MDLCINLNNGTASFIRGWSGIWNGHAFEDNGYETIKLKSQNDFSMIIEAISFAQFKLGISRKKHTNNVVIIVPDYYRYSQKVDINNFCRNTTSISYLRILSASNAMIFSVDFYIANAKNEETALFFNYLDEYLAITWCEIGDGVCEVVKTWELKIKYDDKSFIDKIKQTLTYKTEPVFNRINACYFSNNVPHLEELRNFLHEKSIMKLRTLNEESYNLGGITQLKVAGGHIKNKLFLVATSQSIKTVELSIEKDTTYPTCKSETLTTVTDRQSTIEVPLWVQIPFSNNYELIDVFETKIDSDKSAREEKIQISMTIDANGFIGIEASTDQKKNIHLYNINDECWRKYV